MSRLTKDLKTPHDDTTYSDVVKDAVDRENIVLTKLKHYEDLEEELGCPIDVAIKKIKELEEQYKLFALNFALEYDRKKKEWHIARYNAEDDFDGYSKSIDFKLKDYGKTWWLQEEKHIAKKPKLIDGKLYCSVCNQEIRHNHNYCWDCGHKIEGR